MRCRASIAVLGLVCFFSSVGHAGAQAKPAAPAGVLAPGVREEPSPTIVSITGAGTANAVAEARMTAQTLKEHCQQNASQYPSGAACLKQLQTDFGSKTFRATADCTAGRITTSAELSYTLDGVWPSSSDGAGRTRWRDSDNNIVAPNLFDNGLYISQQWETLCPGPVTPALIARAKGQSGAPAAQSARAAAPSAPPARGATSSAAQRTPSLCAGQVRAGTRAAAQGARTGERDNGRTRRRGAVASPSRRSTRAGGDACTGGGARSSRRQPA